MKKINISDLNQWIDEEKSEVEQSILRNRNSEKLVCTRERDYGEQRIIDKLYMVRWKKAEQEGK